MQGRTVVAAIVKPMLMAHDNSCGVALYELVPAPPVVPCLMVGVVVGIHAPVAAPLQSDSLCLCLGYGGVRHFLTIVIVAGIAVPDWTIGDHPGEYAKEDHAADQGEDADANGHAVIIGSGSHRLF